MVLRKIEGGHLFWSIAAIGLGLLAFNSWQANRPPPSDTILAMGMAPQISLIEDIADENGWEVTCRGVSGDMTVVRLAPGFWPGESPPEVLRDELVFVASSHQSGPPADEAGPMCDLPADTYVLKVVDDSEPIVAGVGTRELIEPLLDVAKSCEVEGAYIEAAVPGDAEFFGVELEPGAVRIMIDPKLETRTGPLSCFGIMSNKVFTEQARES